MSVNLKKGGNISLVKEGNPLKRAVVACGWDVNRRHGHNYDLDLSCAGLGSSGLIPNQMDPQDRDYQEWFIYANHRQPANKSVIFGGDNRTGAGDGDDEMIKVDLDAVPEYIERLLFGVVIWDAVKRGQLFGNVQNAFIRVFDQITGEEFVRYDLGNEFENETFVVFGELYRRNGEWKFRAIGQGYNAATYRAEYGIDRSFETDYARFRN